MEHAQGKQEHFSSNIVWMKSSFSLLNNTHIIYHLIPTKTGLWTQQFLCVLTYFSNQAKNDSDFIIMNTFERLCSKILTEAFYAEKNLI